MPAGRPMVSVKVKDLSTGRLCVAKAGVDQASTLQKKDNTSQMFLNSPELARHLYSPITKVSIIFSLIQIAKLVFSLALPLDLLLH